MENFKKTIEGYFVVAGFLITASLLAGAVQLCCSNLYRLLQIALHP